MGFEHVVGRGVPKTQMLRPARREEAVVAGVKGYPRGRKAVILGSLVHLIFCSLLEKLLKVSTVLNSEGQGGDINFVEGCAQLKGRRNGNVHFLPI